MVNTKIWLVGTCFTSLVWSLPAVAAADAPGDARAAEGSRETAGEIIVTAQKRAESINSVPMSITAASGETLLARGITSPAGLEKIVPGFTFTKTQYNTPVYSIRGVGFYDASLSASPTVSVYVDEAPLPFSIMTAGSSLDVERVEVLKGPQGTLFGQNSTGGAINFIAAKPGTEFEAGFDASYARFDAVDLQGFISTPLTGTLGVRVAARTEQGGAWQRNYLRDDELGTRRFTTGRVLLDWKPASGVQFTLNLNGWVDKSDTVAAQLFVKRPRNPNGVVDPDIAALPLPPAGDARATDWNTDLPLRRDDKFHQVSLRGDIDVADGVVLTTLSTYSKYVGENFQSADGTRLQELDVNIEGRNTAYFQELRLAGDAGPLQWIFGANYSYDKEFERQAFYSNDGSNQFIAGFLQTGLTARANQKANTYAVFGNVEYEVAPGTFLQGAMRYTRHKRDFVGCTADGGSGQQAKAFELLQLLFKGRDPTRVIPIAPGGCTSLDANNNPAFATPSLDEDNVSWRAGIRHRTPGGLLVYGTISQGYKAGSIPALAAAGTAQYTPVVQEKVIAYEAGIKAPLLDKTLQFNAAVFRYDYTNKQLRSRDLLPFFGLTERLVNVPKSKVTGFEAELQWSPLDGLDFTGSAVYVDTEVTQFSGYSVDAVTGSPLSNFQGSAFPYTPKWQVVADGQYKFAVSDDLKAYFGGSLTYHSGTNSAFISMTPSATFNFLKVDPYTLLDARAGIETTDGKWRVAVFVDNLTDEYYFNGVNQLVDVVSRFPGKPRTYGMRVSYRL